jgi:hypothetical protein
VGQPGEGQVELEVLGAGAAMKGEVVGGLSRAGESAGGVLDEVFEALVLLLLAVPALSTAATSLPW